MLFHLKPQNREALQTSDIHVERLLKSLKPFCRQVFKHLYQHDFTCDDLRTSVSQDSLPLDAHPTVVLSSGHPSELKRESSHVEAFSDLPLSAKYILIASFLASYNPPKTDRRVFSTTSRRRRVTKAKGSEEKISPLLQGPSAFPLERMLAIYDHIYEDEEDQSLAKMEKSNFTSGAGQGPPLSHISSLVGLKLLERVIRKTDPFEDVKLKCVMSYDEISDLAKSIKFDIGQYLYDPK